jgi:NADH-quinone oxidoreductase subunit H
MVAELVQDLAKIIFIIGVNLGFFAPMLGWVERKQSAAMQDRVGANRADILGFKVIGLFHIMADAIKIFTKEEFMPAGANKLFHTLAPFISLTIALITFTVIPFGGVYEIFGYKINLVVADLDIGMLFIFAFGSIATYGTVLAGWSSNNNWSLIGGIRAAAQMLSYEVAMGLTLVGVFMVYGTLRLTEIGAMQVNFFKWGLFLQPLGFILFITCAIAENKRIPFDIPEAESEIVAGYFTEYSSMKYVMFLIGEFIEIVTIGGIVTTLFLGAWHIPFVSDKMLLAFFSFAGPNGAGILAMLTNIATFFAKVMFMIWFQMTVRWTLPRFRYDQLMKLGWKMILPLSLINIFVTGLILLLIQ